MFLETAPYGKMAETGRSILRLIQNNRTATLDLLVRECLQNSLDAAISKQSGKDHYVDVEFITNDFDSDKLAVHFDGIDYKLKTMYPRRQRFVAVKDKNTIGLNGPVRAEDTGIGEPFGNFQKLVYEISRPQETEGSGGSWGLGKTVYFRVGIGLVIFYSRIQDEKTGKYESRLAATLVEDETSSRTLLPKSNLSRGIAWWGKRDPRDRTNSIPVTDTAEIRSILNVFGIEPYTGKETGTTIIIPYINEKDLLEETRPHSEDGSAPPYWTQRSVAEYMVIAAQRWYAPRINNPNYKYGSYLRIIENGKRLKNDDIAPLFQLIQKLYNARPDDGSEFNGKKIICKEVDVRNIIDRTKSRTIAGWISFVKVTEEDMRRLPPYNLESPYRYINKETDPNYNNPIIMFTRMPGMIVSYELTGDWVSGIPTTNKDEFIVGLFSAHSQAYLLKYDCTLEEYLRKGEKADHMSWGDWTHDNYKDYHPNITVRIQKGVRKKMADSYAEITEQTASKRNIGLGRMLADFLLPPEGYSSWDDAYGGGKGIGGTGGDGTGPDVGGKGGSTSQRSGRMSMQIIGNPDFREHSIGLKVRISFGSKQSGIIEALVVSEAGMMNMDKWEKQIGSQFPISFNSIEVQQITRKKGKKQTVVFEGTERIYTKSEVEGISFEFCWSSGFQNASMVKIKVPSKDNYVIDAVINYSIAEKGITGNFSFREGE